MSASDCPICMDTFNKPVTIYNCLHTFCKQCLEKITNNICPLCRQKFEISNVKENNLLIDVLNDVILIILIFLIKILIIFNYIKIVQN